MKKLIAILALVALVVPFAAACEKNSGNTNSASVAGLPSATINSSGKAVNSASGSAGSSAGSSGKQQIKGIDNVPLAKTCLDELTTTIDYSPYSYIPEAMRPGYAENIVEASSVAYDLNNFVAKNSVNYGGFGEQWHMVVDNIDQSQNFYKYLNGGEIVTASIALIKNSLDNKKESYADDVKVEDKAFTSKISLKNNIFKYSMSFKTKISIPLFGSVSPNLEMTYDVKNKIKSVYISVNDKNSLRYEIAADSYTFGMQLSLSAYTRTSYISFIKEGSSVTGHIYEYNTVKGKDLTKSCADFYIGSDYVSVVGNKASGIVGFTGYINELYDVRYGKLLGYEIRETLTFAGISGTYNTLWFNLSDISGIESVKAVEKDSHKPNENPHYVYVNGSDGVFEPTYNKKVVKTSRKYDIELRKRYFYATDDSGKTVEIEVEIPMMFIQEDNDKDTNFTDYPSDVAKANGITSEVRLSSVYLRKILADYDELIDVFIANKELISNEYISAYVEG